MLRVELEDFEGNKRYIRENVDRLLRHFNDVY